MMAGFIDTEKQVPIRATEMILPLAVACTISQMILPPVVALSATEMILPPAVLPIGSRAHALFSLAMHANTTIIL